MRSLCGIKQGKGRGKARENLDMKPNLGMTRIGKLVVSEGKYGNARFDQHNTCSVPISCFVYTFIAFKTVLTLA
jgi:hypothetical protein